jgi:hypothetical protein
MLYLCILFIPPVYFVSRDKWGAFALNAFLYGLACLCVLSIMGIMVAPIFWILSVGHAGFHFRREMINKHAELIATKIAAQMRANQDPPGMPPRISK